MRNILSIDVEEYFQVENFKDVISYADWDRYESRLQVGIDMILKILSDYKATITFFVLGWVAERHPDCIRKIAREGHEIGSHGYAHELIYKQTPDEFRSDLMRSLEILASITGKPVVSYRAPCFSVTKRSLWALDILMECGIRNDSSIFPIYHDRYGIPGANKLPHIVREKDGTQLKEFPISIYELFGWHVPFSGGGYFRLLPVSLVIRMAQKLNAVGHPLIMYLHPWEFDKDQPRVSAGRLRTFRHYVNIKHTETKLRLLLDEIKVGAVEQAGKIEN